MRRDELLVLAATRAYRLFRDSSWAAYGRFPRDDGTVL